MHRVIIVGCGFAGLFAANALRRAEIEVVVVDRTNHHLFQALLYQVATGVLSEGDIAPPIRDVLRHHRNTRVLLGEVVDIDPAGRTLTIDTLGQTTTLPYDSLILATGATQSYFGHDEYARDAPGLKTIDDALELRGRIFGAFEMAELEADDAARQPWLTFATVGAGPTGVELAGQIAELSRRACAPTSAASTRQARGSCCSTRWTRCCPATRRGCVGEPDATLRSWGSTCAWALGSSASTRQAWTSMAAASRPAPRYGRQACRPRRSGGCSPTAHRPPSTARAAWRWRPTVRCPGIRRCSSSAI